MKNIISALKSKIFPAQEAPQYIPFDTAPNYYWDKTPLGVDKSGRPVFWEPTVATHMLLTGRSVDIENTLQNIIFHHSIHTDRWEIRGIDQSRAFLYPLRKYDSLISSVAVSVEEGLTMVQEVHEEMMARYAVMESEGVNNVADLAEKKKRILLMIQDAYMFLGKNGIKNEEGKAEDAMKEKASLIISDLARLSRAAGIHVILATSRPDARVIYGELKQNLAARVAAGRIDSIASFMTFGNAEEPTFDPAIKGSAYAKFYEVGMEYTSFKAPHDWLDQKLAAQIPGLDLNGKASYWDPKADNSRLA